MSDKTEKNIAKGKPLVSICCITYNHEKYIKETLDGFLKQKTDFDFEVLIHDDASTDNTAVIIKEYADRYPDIIRPFYQKVNQYSKGIRGMNKLFNYPRVRGKFIALCEGDDYWVDENKLKKQVAILERYPNVSFCFHNRKVRTDFGELEIIPSRKFGKYVSKGIVDSNVALRTFTPLLTIMFRSCYIQDYCNINSRDVFGGDAFLKAYLTTKGDAYFDDFYGGVYRKHSGGVFTSLQSKIIAYNKAITTRLQILERIPEVRKDVVYLELVKFNILLGYENLREKKIIDAFMSIIKTIYFFGLYLKSIILGMFRF